MLEREEFVGGPSDLGESKRRAPEPQEESRGFPAGGQRRYLPS